MRFYIATRYSNEEYRNWAIEIKNELESLGHEMTFDWMNGTSVKPYRDNAKKAKDTAKTALEGAMHADFSLYRNLEARVCM